MSEPVNGRLDSESYNLITERPLALGEVNPLEDGPWWVYGEVRSSDPNTLDVGTKVAMPVYTNKLIHGWGWRQDITEEEYKVLYILRGGDNPGKDTLVKTVEYVDDAHAAWMSGWARGYMDFPSADDEDIRLLVSWREGGEQVGELSLTIKHYFSGKSGDVPLTISVESIPIMAWEYDEPIEAIKAFESSAMIGRMLSVLSGKQDSNPRMSAMDENDDCITLSRRHLTTLENNCDYLLAWPIFGQNLPEYGRHVSLEDLRSYFDGVFKSERKQYAVGLVYEAAYLSVLQGNAYMLILSAAEEIYRDSLQAPTQKIGLHEPLQYLFEQVNERLNLNTNLGGLIIGKVVQYRNNYLGHRQRGTSPDEQVILEHMRLIHKAIMIVLLDVREGGIAYEHYRQRFTSLASKSSVDRGLRESNLAYPTQNEIGYHLLEEIASRGGSAKPSELYDPLADRLGITVVEHGRILDETGENKWKNDVRRTRHQLVKQGLLEPMSVSGRNNWAISAEGREVLNQDFGAFLNAPQADTITPASSKGDATTPHGAQPTS